MRSHFLTYAAKRRILSPFSFAFLVALLLSCAAFLSGCSSGSSAAGSSSFLTRTGIWGGFHADFQNTGRGVGTGATGHVKWQLQTGGAVFSVVAIATDGTIYFGSVDGLLYAVNPADGSVRWTFQADSSIVGSGAAIGPDGAIYFGDTTSLYAVDLATHKLKWKFKTGGHVLSSPVIANNTVYFGSFYVVALGAGDPSGPYDGHFFALDTATGAVRWSYLTGGAIGASPAMGADGTIYIGSYDGVLYAFNSYTGQVRWTYKTNGPIQSSAALGNNGLLYIGSHDGNMRAIDAQTGKLAFAVHTTNRVVSSPGIGADGTVYFGSWDGYVYSVSGSTGAINWKFFTSTTAQPGLNDESPCIGGDGTIYYQTNLGGVLYALNGATGAVKWQLGIDPLNYASIAIDPGGTLYMGSLSGKLIAVD